MKITKVNALPPKAHYRSRLTSMWEEIIRMQTRYVKVDVSKYSSTMVAYRTFVESIKRYCAPLKVHVINGEIYIENLTVD